MITKAFKGTGSRGRIQSILTNVDCSRSKYEPLMILNFKEEPLINFFLDLDLLFLVKKC
jgi:hypothetical protein